MEVESPILSSGSRIKAIVIRCYTQCMTKNRLWLRVDVWFIILTAIYWAAYFAGFGFRFSLLGGNSHLGSVVVNLIGLFVPFGPNNAGFIGVFLAFFTGTASAIWVWVTTGFFLLVGWLAAFLGEKLLKHLTTTPLLKIGANLAFLLFVTLAIDLMLFQEWKSLHILQQSL